MTSHSKLMETVRSTLDIVPKHGRGGPKASEMTSEQLKLAQKRAAVAREKKRLNDAAKEAYKVKIDSLEHQALQYQSVINYLETKVDELQTKSFLRNQKLAGTPF